MCRSGHGKGDLLIAPHAGGQHFAVQLLVGLFREIVHIPSGTWDIAAATRVPRPAPEGAATPVPPDRAPHAVELSQVASLRRVGVWEHIGGTANCLADYLSCPYGPGGTTCCPELRGGPASPLGKWSAAGGLSDSVHWATVTISDVGSYGCTARRGGGSQGAGNRAGPDGALAAEEAIPPISRATAAPRDRPAGRKGGLPAPRSVPPLAGAWEEGKSARSGEAAVPGGAPSVEDGGSALLPRLRVATLRWDHPAVGAGKPRQKGSLAMAAWVSGHPVLRAAAADDFEKGALAITARPVCDNHLMTLQTIAPVGVFICYKRGLFVAGSDWQVGPAVAFRDALFSASRGLGPASRVAAISLCFWLVVNVLACGALGTLGLCATQADPQRRRELEGATSLGGPSRTTRLARSPGGSWRPSSGRFRSPRARARSKGTPCAGRGQSFSPALAFNRGSFGRRGSSAVKAYFEDARAEARSSSGLALPVSEALNFLIRKAEAFFSTSPNLGDTFLAARGPLRGPLLVRAVPRRLPFAGAPLGHEVMHYIVEAVWAQFVVRGRTSSSRGSSSATHVIAEGRLRGPGAAGSLSVVGTLGPFGKRRCIRKRATGKGTVCDVVMPLMLVLGA